MNGQAAPRQPRRAAVVGALGAMWRDQPVAFVALIAVVLASALIFVRIAPGFAIALLVVGLVVALGVKMAKWMHPLGPDEVAVVGGRLGRPVRVVMSGKVFLTPGEILVKLSLRWQQVDFSVECRSGDETPVPVTISMHASFRVPKDEAAIRTVAEKFGADDAAMREHVVACLLGHTRDVVGERTAELVDRAAGEVAVEAFVRARPHLVEKGFELGQLTSSKVELSPEWRAELAKRVAMEARAGTVTAELAIEDQVSRAQTVRRRRELLDLEKAKADANHYVQLRQVELARAHMELAQQKREHERQHLTAMAQLEFYKLRETLSIQGDYHEHTVQRMIVERLPQILEAKNKMLPNLRTYIAGPHEKGLIGLMAGLAEFGPDIMKELQGFVRSLSPGQNGQGPSSQGLGSQGLGSQELGALDAPPELPPDAGSARSQDPAG